MSDDSVHHGEKPSPCSGSSQRVLLSQQQLDSIALESLRSAWKSQDLYIDHLESQNKHFEGSLERAKESEDRIKLQYGESQHRERVLVRRLAAKEQEIQDYMSQITELKSAQASLAGRPTLLDPAVNILILRLKQELAATRARLEETQNELSAWKFTPDSNTGKKLMAKCRLLHQENEDLGRMTSSGRIAKLEGDLALQKSFSEEVKKSQSELDEFLQELDEDVEGMQSTVLFLQQELRAAKERPPTPSGGARTNHRQMNGDVHSRNGEDISGAQVSADVAIDQCNEERAHYKGKGARDHKRTNTTGGELANLKREFGSESESECSIEDSNGGVKKRRRASVLSLDYNEEDDPLTVANGDAE